MPDLESAIEVARQHALQAMKDRRMLAQTEEERRWCSTRAYAAVEIMQSLRALAEGAR